MFKCNSKIFPPAETPGWIQQIQSQQHSGKHKQQSEHKHKH